MPSLWDFDAKGGRQEYVGRPNILSAKPEPDELPVVDALVRAEAVVVIHPSDGEVTPAARTQAHPGQGSRAVLDVPILTIAK